MNEIIKVENVDLIYRSAQTLSVKKLVKMLIKGEKDTLLSNYKALNNVSCSFEKGKVYGIIGNNGAGKSTLLRVLSGVMSPNKGTVERNYKTINLLALGIGFSKELTGIENIFLNGMLLGFSKKEIEAVKNDIIEYSEIGEFVYKPMKTYSSGMVSRLGFAIAIYLKPEVLLIDETLSVGDVRFRKKSFESIKSIILDKNITVVIVSHGMGTVKELCDNLIWLEKGEIIAQGDTTEVLSLYEEYNSGKITMQELKRKNQYSITMIDNTLKVDASDYYIRMPNCTKKQFIEKNYDTIQEVVDRKTIFRVTKRVLNNGDLFLFVEVENNLDQKITIELDGINEVVTFDHLYKKPNYDNRYGENKLTGLNAYLDLDQGSACVTKLYYFKEKEQVYGEKEKSYLLELIQEDNSINIASNKIDIKLKPNKDKVCFSIILSKSKLFNERENLNEYMDYYYEGVYNNFVPASFFLRPDGTYTKLPYSIEPFTKEGYGYSLHHSSRKDLVPFYEKTHERFFIDMISNAILQAYMYQQNENNVFFTPYTSTWLKKDTGITAPYIDTRLNETFIHMLGDIAKYTEFNGKIEPLKEYVDFLINKQEDGTMIYQKGEGVFFPDYFKDNLGKMPHASLNHQLGTASLFYKAYIKYEETMYLEMFDRIIEFIEATKENWINKENGDLYYGLKMHKGELEYYGNDYVYVTLLDLLNTQNIIVTRRDNKIKAKNESLNYLIQAKIEYLSKTEYDIFNADAKIAPGEKIESRLQVLKLYQKLYINDK